MVGGRGGGPSLLRRGENGRTAMPRPGGPCRPKQTRGRYALGVIHVHVLVLLLLLSWSSLFVVVVVDVVVDVVDVVGVVDVVDVVDVVVFCIKLELSWAILELC